MNYHTLDDSTLLNLLFTQEDRLPRAAVDESIRRGERMIKPLSDIVSEQYSWTRDMPEWWAVVHAVYILGAIGGEDVVIPLLKGMRWAIPYDCDWVTEDLPSILGRVGIVAIHELKRVAKDKTSDWFTRAIAIEGLAAVTIHNPEIEEDIFMFIGAILNDEREERETRQTAGSVLIDFLRSEFKEDLFAFGCEEKRLKDADSDYMSSFYDGDVMEWFSEGKKDLWSYSREWLSFYDEDEINKRQIRWKEEEQKRLEQERLKVSGEKPFVREEPKIGRNDPCPCGSGKKYKKCCIGKMIWQ